VRVRSHEAVDEAKPCRRLVGSSKVVMQVDGRFFQPRPLSRRLCRSASSRSPPRIRGGTACRLRDVLGPSLQVSCSLGACALRDGCLHRMPGRRDEISGPETRVAMVAPPYQIKRTKDSTIRKRPQPPGGCRAGQRHAESDARERDSEVRGTDQTSSSDSRRTPSPRSRGFS